MIVGNITEEELGPMGVVSGAEISSCGKYRYNLWRKIGNGEKKCVFIMLNPSTADALLDDPTIRRCIAYAKAWGCAKVTVVNLFAYRATDPKELRKTPDPIGPDNLEKMGEAIDSAIFWENTGMSTDRGIVVCAWGAHGTYLGRDYTVLRWMREKGVTPLALKLTKDGQPCHPLYLKKDLVPKPFEDLKL